MRQLFRRFVLGELLLFGGYIGVAFYTADKFPKELMDWIEADAMSRPGAFATAAVLALIVAVAFPLSLMLLRAGRRYGRCLFLRILPPLVLGVHVLQPISIGERWSELCFTGVLVGYGFIGGLLFHPEVKEMFAQSPPPLPDAKPDKTRRVILWVVCGAVVCVIGFFGLCLVIIKVLPEPASEGLEVKDIAPLKVDSERDEIDKALAKLTDRFMENERNKGIAIGVIRDGVRTIAVRGSGVRADSLFEIGSISKTFTGLALADAVQSGVVGLEQPIHTLLQSADGPIMAEGKPLTLLDLATHSSGLPRLSGDLGIWKTLSVRPYGGFTAEDLEAALLRTQTGKREYSYSNFGMTVLAHLLGRANETSFPKLQQDLVGRFGLTNTFIELPADLKGRLLAGHRWGLETAYWYDSGVYIDGAGSTLSSVDDMLGYLEFSMNPKQSELKDAIALATQGQRDAGGKTQRIGLGWHRGEDEKLGPIIWHDGATRGFCAYAGFAPKVKTGVVVLSNSGDMAAIDLGTQIMKALAGHD